MLSKKARSAFLFSSACGAAWALQVPREFTSDNQAAILKTVLFDSDVSSLIQDHGCWCSRLGTPADRKNVRGQPVDVLDALCRNWFNARYCSESLPQGSCYRQPGAESYQVVGRSEATADAYSYAEHACLPAEDECAFDSCKIDLYYATRINQYLSLVPHFRYDSSPICDRGPSGPKPKFCQLPGLKMKYIF